MVIRYLHSCSCFLNALWLKRSIALLLFNLTTNLYCLVTGRKRMTTLGCCEYALVNHLNSSSSSLPFLFSGSNFTSQQVQDAAQRYSTELSRLGTVLKLDMPWDFSFSPRGACLLQGTSTALDAIYRIDSIERHYSATSGSGQLVRAVQI